MARTRYYEDSPTTMMITLIGLSLFLFTSCLGALSSQTTVTTVAGGKIRSGVPAQDVLLGRIGGVTVDSKGSIVFSEAGRHVIRRLGADGTIETIAGTGVSGFPECHPLLASS